MLWETERVDVSLADCLEEAGQARPGAQPGGPASRSCAAYAPGLSVADCLARAAGPRSPRRSGRGRPPAARGATRVRRGGGAGQHPGTRSGPGGRRRPTSAGTRPTSTSRRPTTSTCRPSTTSRRRTRRGRRRSARLHPRRGRPAVQSVHEVWPGHFLQFLHSNRSRLIRAALRRATASPRAGPTTPRR